MIHAYKACSATLSYYIDSNVFDTTQAAIIVQHVSYERGETGMNITNSVGYSTRHAKELPQSLNSITYVTEGTLVNIVDNAAFSHIVLDEVQERSVHIDLPLMKIKKKFHEKPLLKLIVMTATVDAHPIEE